MNNQNVSRMDRRSERGKEAYMAELREKVGKFVQIADEFIKEMHVSDMVVLKFCLMSLGIIVGICLPKKWKRPALFTALFVFIITYLPLVTKWGTFLGSACCGFRKDN